MLINPVDNRWLYNAVDFTRKSLHPMSDFYYQMFKQLAGLSENMYMPMDPATRKFDRATHQQTVQDIFEMPRHWVRTMAGICYVNHMILDTYHKPEFGIEEIQIDDEYYDVSQEVIKRKNFCDLLYFKKIKYPKELPKMLLVAPLSGHYATLLRDTVVDMLPFYDVYITDWKNARDVPLSAGSFDLNDYVQYMIGFMQLMGPNLHVMAICQATVPTMVAIAALSAAKDPNVPQTVTLLGGPIDTSQSPTAVNDLAMSRDENWFKQNVITIVPEAYPGYMRLVYPGFMQLMAFLSMNGERHLESMRNAIEAYSHDDVERAYKIVRFYAEYFSTMDLTAEFYMQTIDTVFQSKLLVQGRHKFRGKNVNLKDIDHTAILAIEGEKDDITGIGQTESVLDHCKNLPEEKKAYFVGKDVGHYGLFNGSKFRHIILPTIRNFTELHKYNSH